jgi:hypothetical protein
VKEYFLLAIAQHIERAAQLLTKIDNSDVPREYHLLASNCRNELVSAKQELEDLQNKPDLQHPDLQGVRLRRFRRAVDRISKLEVTGVAALSRPDRDDMFLTRLVDLIRKEIKYPSLPPAVTTLSSNYFHIHNNLKLMFVPLSEGNYLLHLPDIYHELAHPLLFDDHNTSVKELRRCADLAWAYALEYLASEIDHEQRRRVPQMNEYLFYFMLWKHSWRSWIIEFFYDLFAIFTLGSAFAWSHIHLCMKFEQDPFHVPTLSRSSHPADHARMCVMLLGLEKGGDVKEVQDLQNRWDEYLRIANVKISANYKRCFPDDLLQRIVDLAYTGMHESPCRIVNASVNDPIHTILNEAWHKFWHHPHTYIDWEKTQVSRLRELCGINGVPPKNLINAPIVHEE